MRKRKIADIKTVVLKGGEGKKYLTQIQETQREWIRQAAKELEVTQPAIVQMSLMRMIHSEWPKLKEEWIKTKTQEKLEALEKEHRRREREIAELRAKIQPTEKQEIAVEN